MESQAGSWLGAVQSERAGHRLGTDWGALVGEQKINGYCVVVFHTTPEEMQSIDHSSLYAKESKGMK